MSFKPAFRLVCDDSGEGRMHMGFNGELLVVCAIVGGKVKVCCLCKTMKNGGGLEEKKKGM